MAVFSLICCLQAGGWLCPNRCTQQSLAAVNLAVPKEELQLLAAKSSTECFQIHSDVPWLGRAKL